MAALTAELYLKIRCSRKTLELEDFLHRWIPKLYGIQPDEYGFRKACITELSRLMSGVITARGIDKNWKWQNGQTDYPPYVKPLLDLADEKYRIMEQLKVLPNYNKTENKPPSEDT